MAVLLKLSNWSNVWNNIKMDIIWPPFYPMYYVLTWNQIFWRILLWETFQSCLFVSRLLRHFYKPSVHTPNFCPACSQNVHTFPTCCKKRKINFISSSTLIYSIRNDGHRVVFFYLIIDLKYQVFLLYFSGEHFVWWTHYILFLFIT